MVDNNMADGYMHIISVQYLLSFNMLLYFIVSAKQGTTKDMAYVYVQGVCVYPSVCLSVYLSVCARVCVRMHVYVVECVCVLCHTVSFFLPTKTSERHCAL